MSQTLDSSCLEFYNPDKGRKTLNLTEKYKKTECWQ
nr:MAG TPA: hypothetical protein [Inoviridae sp.]